MRVEQLRFSRTEQLLTLLNTDEKIRFSWNDTLVDQILKLISASVQKIENPEHIYSGQHEGFESCRQSVMRILKK